MLRKVISLIVVILISKEIPLQPEVFDTETSEAEVVYQSENLISESPKSAPIIAPTVAPVSARVASKQPAPTITPTPAPKSTQEPDSPPKGKYVEGFGYVEYSGPNQCEVVDSNGDINKIVGYMGDEPECTKKPKKEDVEIYFPKDEQNIYNGRQ